jgi:hypothetical protein
VFRPARRRSIASAIPHSAIEGRPWFRHTPTLSKPAPLMEYRSRVIRLPASTRLPPRSTRSSLTSCLDAVLKRRAEMRLPGPHPWAKALSGAPPSRLADECSLSIIAALRSATNESDVSPSTDRGGPGKREAG